MTSTAIGGTSVMSVSYAGTLEELAAALEARGLTVAAGSKRARHQPLTGAVPARMSRNAPSQIALPLSARTPTGAQRIVVGKANAAVIEALQDPSRWPFHVAVLTGPARSGKSLLARWAQTLAQPEALEVIDDAESMDETDLFHRWNAVQEGGVREGAALLIVANADQDKGGWRISLPDLASRIGGSLQLVIAAPDDVLAAELILAHAGSARPDPARRGNGVPRAPYRAQLCRDRGAGGDNRPHLS